MSKRPHSGGHEKADSPRSARSGCTIKRPKLVLPGEEERRQRSTKGRGAQGMAASMKFCLSALDSTMKHREAAGFLLPVNQISHNQAKGLLNACVYMTKAQTDHYRPLLAEQRAIWEVGGGDAEAKLNFVKLRDSLMAGDVEPGSDEYQALVMDPRSIIANDA